MTKDELLKGLDLIPELCKFDTKWKVAIRKIVEQHFENKEYDDCVDEMVKHYRRLGQSPDSEKPQLVKSHDSEAGVYYFKFTDKPVAKTTEEVEDFVNIDWDEQGQVVGVEILMHDGEGEADEELLSIKIAEALNEYMGGGSRNRVQPSFAIVKSVIKAIKQLLQQKRTVTREEIGLLATTLFDNVVTKAWGVEDIMNILIPWITASGIEVVG